MSIKHIFVFISTIFFFNISLSLAKVFLSQNDSHRVEFTSSNLPIVVIDTNGQTIVDLYRIVAHMGVIYNGEGQRNYYTTDTFNNYDGRIAIELRGSSSSAYPKKQYRLETQNELGENLNVKLIDMPKENDWILYGPYDDLSLIRNVLAFKLSNEIGRYASRTRCCELVLNNDYQGLYVLLEKIKRDKNRVNIADMDSTDNTADAVTGGYIFKIDKLEGENIDGWWSNGDIFYQYHFPNEDDIILAQKAYIRNYVNQFEAILSLPDPSNPSYGYPTFINIASFVDHFILNEVAKNVDAYRISHFLHKDRDSEDKLLCAGPIWDFNLSFGKAWYPEDDYLIEGWEVDHDLSRPDDWPKIPFWWEKLGHDRVFAQQVNDRWTELKTRELSTDHIFGIIDSLVTFLAEARERNSQRWPEMGNGEIYTMEIVLLKQWTIDRINWINNNINRLTTIKNQTTTFPAQFILEQNYPNPFNAITTFNYHLPQSCPVRIDLLNINGQLINTLFEAIMPAGVYELEFDASKFCSGIYFYRIQAGHFSAVKKMIMLR